jgi:hypothetical protein
LLEQATAPEADRLAIFVIAAIVVAVSSVVVVAIQGSMLADLALFGEAARGTASTIAAAITIEKAHAGDRRGPPSSSSARSRQERAAARDAERDERIRVGRGGGRGRAAHSWLAGRRFLALASTTQSIMHDRAW